MARTRKISTNPVRQQGRETRKRLLRELSTQLRTRPIRNVTVTEIAEGAGVTPAAYYQYFTDLQDAILALSEDVIADARGLVDLVSGDWDSEGEAIARRLVDGLFDFWERNEGLMGVVELAIDEHDAQFNRFRQSILGDTTVALSLVISNFKLRGRYSTDVAPREMAAALLAIPLHVRSRLWLYQRWGLDVEALKNSMIDIIVTAVTRPGNADPNTVIAPPRR